MPTIQIRWATNVDELKRNLKEGLNQIEATKAATDKMVQSLSGDKLKQAAHNFAAAVNELGGVEKLTNAERERGNALLTKTIEKYKVLGQVAPSAIRELAQATQQVKPLPPTFFEKFGTDLKTQIVGVAAGFVSAQAAIGLFRNGVELAQASIRAFVGFLGESITAFSEAEAAQKKLTAALTAQGTASPEVIQQYNALATQMQRTTVFSDDLTTEMQALLVQIGDVMPSQMQEALKASADLAAGLGIDLQTATTLVAKAAAGHTETLGRYGITVDKAALATQGFSAVLDAVNKQFGGQAAAQLDTYAGRLQQIANAWDNVKEAVGKAIVNNPLAIKGLRDASEGMNQLDESASGAEFTLSGLLNTTRKLGGDPVLLDFLIIATTYLENAADEANKLQAALASIKPPTGFTTSQTPAGFFKPTAPGLGGDPGGLALDKAIAKAKKDNAEVQKELAELHKKVLAAFEAWFQAGVKFLSVWKVAMLPSEQIAEGFATVTEEVIDLNKAIDESDAVAAGFNKNKTLITQTLDEMRQKAEETAEAFRKAFGIMAGLSLALPPGQVPGNQGAVAGARSGQDLADQIRRTQELQQVTQALADDLRLVGDVAGGTFGEMVTGIASVITSFQNVIVAIQNATSAMLTLNAALGVFGLGFLIGSVVARRLRGGATGGVVTPTGIQHFKGGGFAQPAIRLPRFAQGTDSVPALLTPGEMVLNAGQQARLFQMANGRASGAGGQIIENHYHTHNWDLRQAVITNDQGLDRLSREVAKRNATGVARNQDSVNTRGRAGYGLRS